MGETAFNGIYRQAVPPMSKLRREVARSVRLNGLSLAVVTVIQLAQLAVLARLLGPAAFGLMAIVLIVVSLGELFAQMGLHEAIIARRDVSRAELSSLYWFGIASGAVVYLVIWLLTPLIAAAFREPELHSLVPVALASVLIAPFGTPFVALAQRELRFGLIAPVEIGSALVGLAIAVTSAWAWDQGVWALVWGQLSRTIAATGTFCVHGWMAGPRPGFHFSTADLQGFLGFGFYRVAAMSVNFLTSRVDQILIGGVFGAQALGYYSMAANIALLPVQKINPVVTRVAFPAFARIRDDLAGLRRGYLQLLRSLTFVNAPILLGMAAVAPLAMPILLGPQWRESVPLVQILAVYALLRSVGNASGSFLLGMGRADITFFWNLGFLLVSPLAIYLASLAGSLAYVAWMMVALQTVLYLAFYALVIRRLLGPCFLPFAGAFVIPASLAAVMGVVVVGVDPLFVGLSPLQRLVVQVVIGFLCYAALVFIFQRRRYADFRDMMFRA